MQLSIGKDPDIRQEGTPRFLERVWEEATEHDTTRAGEASHQYEEPEPTWTSCYTSHVKDAVCEEFRRRLTELVSEVEHHDALGCFFTSVPCR